MKHLYSLLVLFITPIAFAQYNTDGLGQPVQGVEIIDLTRELQGTDSLANELPAEGEESMIDFPIIGDDNYTGATKGQFTVSLSGEAQYNLPIEAPPGINGIVPEVGLIFNSNSQNGIAGYGWNISGLSAINKVGSNKFFDGKNSIINYSSDDRFMLDGQRLLLKSGTYGMDGAEYQTETYSNLKITSHGNPQPNYGPEYFKVQYPDGNIAYYGRNYTFGGSTRTNTVYALTYVTTPQNVVITYSYINDNGNLLISSISYGFRSTNPLNSLHLPNTTNYISFTYKNRNRSESGYNFNEAIKLTKILDKITVRGFAENYRTYELTYNITSLGYERLQRITEISGDGTMTKKPVSFSYGADSTSNDLIAEEVFDVEDQFGIGFGNLSRNNTKILTGNISGQGRTGFLMHFTSIDGNQTTIGDNLYIYNPSNPNNPGEPIILKQSFGSTPFLEVVTSKRLNHNNTLLPNDGWTIIRQTGATANAVTYQFNSYIYMPTTANNIYPIGTQQTATMYGQANVRRQFISGDFNGDGITEIVRTEHARNYRNESYNQYSSGVDIFDTAANTVYATPSIPIGFQYIITDTDGDGYDEFIVIRHGNIRVYKFNLDTKQLELYSDEYAPHVNYGKPIYTGDFNGDGKLDFVTPASNNSFEWVFYINKDNGNYNHFVKNTGIKYETDILIYENKMYNRFQGFNYVLTDINNDGKTDLIKTYDNCRVDRSNGSEIPMQNTLVWTYENLEFDAGTQNVNFKIPASPQLLDSPANRYPLIASTNYDKSTYKTELSMITGNKLKILKSKKDNVLTHQLKSINEYDITTRITYDVYDEKKNDPIEDGEDAIIPFSSYKESMSVYPKVDMDVVPGLYLVTKVTYDTQKKLIIVGNPTERKQLFSYADATLNFNGKGFLGFKGTMATNIYRGGPSINELQDQLKYVVKFDLDNNGLPIEELSAHSVDWMNFFIPPVNFMNKKTNTYNITTLSNKVFKADNTQFVYQDGLTGVQRTVISTFDTYSNPLSITESVTGNGENSSLNTVYTYNNSLVDNNYYIGRTASKTVKMNNVQNLNEAYFYNNNNNLITQIIKQGDTGSSLLFENYQYDIFGNVNQKTVSASDIETRIESHVYDTSGRYIEKFIDVYGLETNYAYNKNKGWLLSETNPYGLSTSHSYNAMGMKISETDYLGKSTTYAYKTNGAFVIEPSFVRLETEYSDGRKERTTTNSWGNKTRVDYTDIEGNWVNTSYSYDTQNRLIQKSEPYASTASLFTIYEYDKYGRMIKTLLPTGREINASYSGLTTTVNDGIKTKTETKNINNQTKTVVDNGETINYSYNANGTMSSTSYDGTVVSFEYDGWGRKTKMTDPSAGIHSYEYNTVGDLLKETTPDGVKNYSYDVGGRILNINYIGNNINYIYDSEKVLERITMSSTVGQYQEIFTYDTYKRLTSKQYTTPLGFNYTYTYTFDDLGRLETEEKKVTGASGTDFVKTKNVFKNGYLWKVQDFATNTDIKVYDSFNERGQVTSLTFGNGLSYDLSYDQYGYLTQSTVNKNNAQFFTLTNTWDVERGNLTSRSNNLFLGGISETFQYDSFDRLTHNETKQGTVVISQETTTYDSKGRILSNGVGDYKYDSAKQYQLKEVENLNDLAYYQNNPLQEVAYNVNRVPTSIKQQGKENIYMRYDGFSNRTAMYYGNEAADENDSSKVRYYSPQGDIEVDFDKTTNQYVVNIYVDGSSYNASVLQRKENNATAFFYLHRDYLGSILAITDDTGDFVEKRHFDAWGNILLVQDGQNNNLDKLTFLERGYTGHEHLQGVGLINMNARLYDAKLHRFLGADNFMQDPTNSQGFNRYGYVWNNPLKFTDPNGEYIVTAMIVGAIIGAYLGGSAANDNFNPFQWDWSAGSTLTGIAGGAVMGAISGASFGFGFAAITGGLQGTPFLVQALGYTTFASHAITTTTSIISVASNFENGMRIIAGKYALDRDRGFWGGIWQGVSRVTWEGLMNRIGYNYSNIRNIGGKVDRVDYFGGATFLTNENDSRTNTGNGIALGSFININIPDEIPTNISFHDYVLSAPLYMHEYGHVLQSERTGIAFAVNYGIPSIFSAIKDRNNPDYDHNNYRTETSANRWAQKYFGDRYDIIWDFPRYPLR